MIKSSADRFTIVRVNNGTSVHPIIIDRRTGVCEPAALFLNECGPAQRSLSSGTVFDVAYVMKDWLNFLNRKRQSFFNADRGLFHMWLREALARRIMARRVRRRGEIIARWYCMRGLCAPQGSNLLAFKDSIAITDEWGRFVELRVTAPRGPRLKYGQRPIPDPADVGSVLERLSGDGMGFKRSRDWLIGKLGSCCGLRAGGIAGISLKDVADTLVDASVLDKGVNLDVVAEDDVQFAKLLVRLAAQSRFGYTPRLFVIEKGNRGRYVALPFELLEQILFFIGGERRLYVRTSRRSLAPTGLFPSRKGGSLRVGSIKDIVRDAFVASKIQGSAHSLRAAYLTDAAIRLMRKASENKTSRKDTLDIEGVVVRLMELAGHASAGSLKHYIDQARLVSAFPNGVDE